ncbi:YjzC family protein [Alicyclobacillus fastidiosus]|uniref:YjzC family protein n=1 Tax=Alicyclobacillus fastidiosus TaxID=392011 RepID=A0ABV5ADJ2_9BACL|nr:YjzC family protein [Alicyclobacillus fastidiosus]WEH08700.1 YjzC family protein [Alicyclobacillus fastidiosus]
MGEWSEFNPGYEVPNTGVYIEVGEHPDSGDLTAPQRVHLHKGDKFPRTTNGNRKWRRIKTNKKH